MRRMTIVSDPRLKSTPPLERCLAICVAFWQAFEVECKAWVLQAIETDIHSRSAIPALPANETPLGFRLDAVKHLRQSDHPFSIAMTNFLNRAVQTDKYSVRVGLPRGSQEKTTRFEFVRGILESRVWSSKGPTAPFPSRSFSFALLTKLVGVLPTLLPRAFPNQRKEREFILEILVQSLSAANIANVPWYEAPGNVGVDGGRKPSWKFWLGLSTPLDPQPRHRVPQDEIIDISISDDEQVVIDANIAAEQALQSDPGAEWVSVRWPLCDLVRYLHKSVVPVEFNPISCLTASEEGLVFDVYTWVSLNFRMHIPTHRLALFVAIIVSRMLPKIQVQRKTRIPLGTPANPEDIRHFLHTVSLEIPANKAGKMAQEPFISAVTTIAVAIWDERSPLRRRYEAAAKLPGRAGAGESWTSKHGEYFLQVL